MGDIKARVCNLIKKYKTHDPFEIAEMRNVHVFFEPLGKTLGYYSSHKRICFIHINNQIDIMIQRFVCAHELGHAILHPKSNTPFLRTNTYFSVDKIEVEANIFAVELLLPDKVIYEHQNTEDTIFDAAAMYGIPNEVIHFKKMP